MSGRHAALSPLPVRCQPWLATVLARRKPSRIFRGRVSAGWNFRGCPTRTGFGSRPHPVWRFASRRVWAPAAPGLGPRTVRGGALTYVAFSAETSATGLVPLPSALSPAAPQSWPLPVSASDLMAKVVSPDLVSAARFGFSRDFGVHGDRSSCGPFSASSPVPVLAGHWAGAQKTLEKFSRYRFSRPEFPGVVHAVTGLGPGRTRFGGSPRAGFGLRPHPVWARGLSGGGLSLT